ncbi:MAG: arylsulfatase [Lewinella sp.]
MIRDFNSRKSVLHVFVLASLGWFTVACGTSPASEPEAIISQPNIIFIMADDLGYGDLGCYGQEVIRTPELDQMAKEGMRFTDCYAGSPVCAPSRSVLMTGQHTGHTTVRGNFGIGGVTGLGGGQGRIPLAATDTTVAAVLKHAGYTTGMVGKWGLGEPNTTGLPGKQGFDYFYGFLNQRRAHTYYPDYVWENNEKISLEGNQDGQRKDYIHERFTQGALDFIKRNKQAPFFLYLPYTVPHDEYEIPGLGRFADSTHWSEDERVYAAMVEGLSNDVGRILATLKAENIDDNTIVFFCSDNGAASRWEGRFNSSGALKGRKRDLYEGGIRTPMIVRYPGKVPAGVVSEYPWYFADVLPTLASIGNATVPAAVDGVDVSGVVFGSKKSKRESPMYWEFYEGGYQQAVRWGNWKGVQPEMKADWEIYDLSGDAGEHNNIAGDKPQVVAKMTELAEAAHRTSPHFTVKNK